MCTILYYVMFLCIICHCSNKLFHIIYFKPLEFKSLPANQKATFLHAELRYTGVPASIFRTVIFL